MGQCRRTVNSTGRSIDQYSLHIRAGFILSPDSTLQITRCTQQASLQNPSTHPSTRFPISFHRPTVQSNPCLSHPVESHCCRIALHCVMPCVPFIQFAIPPPLLCFACFPGLPLLVIETSAFHCLKGITLPSAAEPLLSVLSHCPAYLLTCQCRPN